MALYGELNCDFGGLVWPGVAQSLLPLALFMALS